MNRPSTACPCCDYGNINSYPALISDFLAERAWGGHNETTELFCCETCGYRWFLRGLSDTEAGKYYAGYLNESWQLHRQTFEPWITKKLISGINEFKGSQCRRTELSKLFSRHQLPNRFENVLDYGGDSGAFIRDIEADYKAVYELPAMRVENGITLISDRDTLMSKKWDLVTCTHVLEHLTYPNVAVDDMSKMITPGGYLYIEVPYQPVRLGWYAPRWFVELIRGHIPRMLYDAYGVACRAATGINPPWGALFMREHIQFFTTGALTRLLNRAGFAVMHVDINHMDATSKSFTEGHIRVLARREIK